MYNFLFLRELDHQRPWWRVVWGAVCGHEHSWLAFPETSLLSVYFFSSMNPLAASPVSNFQSLTKPGSIFSDGPNALNFWWLLWNNSFCFPQFLAYVLKGIIDSHLQGNSLRNPKYYAAAGGEVGCRCVLSCPLSLPVTPSQNTFGEQQEMCMWTGTKETVAPSFAMGLPRGTKELLFATGPCSVSPLCPSLRWQICWQCH